MKNIIVLVLTIAIVSVCSATHLFAQTQEQLEERAEQVQQQKFEIMQVNAELFQGGAAAIRKYVADDAAFTSSMGVFALTKADLLKIAKLDKHRVNPIKLNVIQVTPQNGTAVVFGFATEKWQVGKKVQTLRSSFLNVFAKRNNRWQLIAQQVTNLPTENRRKSRN